TRFSRDWSSDVCSSDLRPRPAKKTAKSRRKSASANEPEFVQLLTPEGQRRSHPDYDVSFTDDEYRGLYRDLVITRELDAQGTARSEERRVGKAGRTAEA